jgi:uncharacterized protein YecE (DUF72 family)
MGGYGGDLVTVCWRIGRKLGDPFDLNIEHFRFRDLHPNIFMGTASDRYSGWIGQIYSRERYADKIVTRSKRVGGKTFAEEVLPVASVEEYFRHFRVLELDFTFYRPLLDKDGKATQNLHVLRTYTQHLNKTDRLILKVPQAVFAKSVWLKGRHIENEEYLNPDVFTRQFYEPALGLLAAWLDGLIFEQEYQRKQDRPSPKKLAGELDTFFSAIPTDTRYHIELRTEALLTNPVFEILEKHGVGQVLSHWTWLPSLNRQFSLSGGKFLNAGKRSIIRLMTPRGMRYQDAYARAHPFNAMVDGMLNPKMVDETVGIMRTAIAGDTQINVIINNRSGGNAPIIAQKIAKEFLAGH